MKFALACWAVAVVLIVAGMVSEWRSRRAWIRSEHEATSIDLRSGRIFPLELPPAHVLAADSVTAAKIATSTITTFDFLPRISWHAPEISWRASEHGL